MSQSGGDERPAAAARRGERGGAVERGRGRQPGNEMSELLITGGGVSY